MKSCNCETGARTIGGGAGAPPYRKSSFLSRFFSLIGWIVPSAILALIPKCPVCLAGYALVGTSVGFSLSTIAHLRLALVILCIASLSFLSARYIFHVILRPTPKTRP